MDSEQLMSIGEVAQQTGVNPVTLRAWQRRFGLITPKRTPKGHRLYSLADIERIRAIQSWLAKGVAVSRVKPLLDNESQPVEHSDDEWSRQHQLLDEALISLNLGKLQALLDEASAIYPFKMFFQYLLSPWLLALSERLAEREDFLLINDWLLHQIQRRIGALAFQQKGPFNGHCVLIETEDSGWQSLLAGFELTALNFNWQKINEKLVNGLPLIIERLHLNAVIVALPSNMTKARITQLEDLQQRLGCPVILYGQYADIHPFSRSLNTMNNGELAGLTSLLGELG